LVDDTLLTEQDKTQLLEYLRAVHGTKETKNKITLTRRQTTEIKKADSTGKARTIQVEVRKKRVLIKRDATPAVPETPVTLPQPAPIDAEQTAIREEEARKQAELSARQAADVVAKQERQKKRKGGQEAAAPAEAPAPAPEPQSAAPVEATPAPTNVSAETRPT